MTALCSSAGSCLPDCVTCESYRRILERVRATAAAMKPVRMHVRRPGFDPPFIWAPYVPIGSPEIGLGPKGGFATTAIMKRRSLPGFATTLTFPKLRTFDPTPISALWADGSWVPESLRRNVADYAAIDGESLDVETEALARDHDDHFWPHKNGCPVCGSDAYVGFASVECSNGGCSNFVYRAGM